MDSKQSNQFSQFFARRLTDALVDRLFPRGLLSNPLNDRWTRFINGVEKVGAGFEEAARAVLSMKEPTEEVLPSRSGKAFPNLYGYFVVAIAKGEVLVFHDSGPFKIPNGAEVFLVADLKDQPLARIQGVIRQNRLDQVAGQISDSSYALDLWLDPGVSGWSSEPTNPNQDRSERKLQDAQRVGRFLQQFMSGRDDLTIQEFCTSADALLAPLVSATLHAEALRAPNGAAPAIEELRSRVVGLTGLDCRVRVRPGSRAYPHQFVLDENTVSRAYEFTPTNADRWVDIDGTSGWSCGNCNTPNQMSHSFCQECGAARPSGVKQASVNDRPIVSVDDQQVVLDLRFLSYDQPQVNLDQIALHCIEVLRPYCRRFSVDSLVEPSSLINMGRLLDDDFGSWAHGRVGEFAVIDLRSADTDWRLQTRARVSEQIRMLKGEQADLEVVEAGMAVREAQLVSARKQRDLRAREGREEIESRKLEQDLQLDALTLDATGAVGEERVAAWKDVEIERVNREAQRTVRDLDREDSSSASAWDRSQDVSKLEHEIELEKRVLGHDLEKEQRLSTAVREGREQDAVSQDRISRLADDRELQRARAQQDIGLAAERVRMEQEIAKQKAELEVRLLEEKAQREKLLLMAEMELRQREAMKGLSAEQILAMQASSLAQAGATSALEKLAGAGADTERRLADEKAMLYERMLAMQQSSNDSANDRQLAIMKAALDANQKAGERVDKAHERTAESAERWNEKSIDAMAKVATAAAGKGGKAAPADSPKASREVECSNPECGASVPAKARFCSECGTAVGEA